MILFIDDEKRRMKSYVEELELSEYKVEFQSNVDSALEYFKNNQEQIELVVLDIMMPTGKAFNNGKAEKGLKTGICFYEEIRNIKPMLPIIIFTNVSDKKVLQDIEVNEITLFCEKINFVPVEFVKEINNLLIK